MSELTIVYRSLTDLKPSPGNARLHPKKQIDQLVASIRSHNDYLSPIVIDEACQILCGHGRLQAARKLGMATVPTLQLLDLSEVQKRSLRLADNRIPLNAAWDNDLLRIEIQAIQELEISFDFDAIGFDAAEVDKLTVAGDHDPDDNVLPSAPETPVSQWGDIWRLGPHRVGCGDSQDLAFVRRVVGSDLVDAAFHDPPYNVKINGHAVGSGRHREFAMASGEMGSESFRRFLHDGLSAAAAVSRPGAVHFICMDHRHLEDLSAACEGVFGARLNICVWRKSNAGMGSLYRSQHEMVFVMRVGDVQHHNAVELGKHGRNRTNVWDYASVNTPQKGRRMDLDLHPTTKPVQMVADAILDVTRPNDLVLDSYLGSGTTLVAALRTGRRCRGIDIDAAYVDLAVRRWVELTGDEVVLEATGQSFQEVQASRTARPA